jgi:Gly-Xaa carboxypeptidase
VPVEPITLGQWLHPPYSGFYDGRYIWGRGSADDKSGLTGILASIETLIKKGFKPRRTVVISMGFDEEVSGRMVSSYLVNLGRE